MYLDCDTTPPIKGRYTMAKKLPVVVEQAKKLIATAEGQIGIYDRSNGGEFYGYVIRYAGQSAYFEPAVEQ